MRPHDLAILIDWRFPANSKDGPHKGVQSDVDGERDNTQLGASHSAVAGELFSCSPRYLLPPSQIGTDDPHGKCRAWLLIAWHFAGDIRAHGRMSPSSRDVERSIGAQLRHHTFSPTTVANPGGRQEQCEMSDYPARQLRGDPVKDLASSSKDLKATLESLSASFKVGTRPSTFTPTAQTQQSKTPSSTSNYGQPTSMYKAGMMHGEQAGSPNKSPVNRSVLDSSPKTLPVVAAEVSRYTAAAPETANQKQQLAHHGESEGSWYNAPGAAAAASAAHDGSTSHWDQRETVSSASKSSAFSPQEHKSAVSFTDLVDRPVSPTGGWGVSEVRPGTKMEVPIGRVFFKEIPVPVEKIVYKEVPVPYEVPGPVVERFREVPVDRIIVQEKIVNVERFITKEVGRASVFKCISSRIRLARASRALGSSPGGNA